MTRATDKNGVAWGGTGRKFLPRLLPSEEVRLPMETELFETEMHGPASGAGIAAGLILNMLLEEVLAMKHEDERDEMLLRLKHRAYQAITALPTPKGVEAKHVLDIAFAPKL